MTDISENQRTENQVMHDRIAQRAFELFLARGATPGQDIEDWLRAEHELRASNREMSCE